MHFPLDLSRFHSLSFSLDQEQLDDTHLAKLEENIALVREAIVFMTAYSNKKGVGGHTGGAYDITPEVLIMEAFMSGSTPIHPVHFDDAGHRVAIQYVLAVLHGHLPAEALLHYREYDSRLPGHPESELTPGIEFDSGRLGHLWSWVNGLATAQPNQQYVLYSSDGAQQEGNSAEAARYAVAHRLPIKLLIDDNNVTITDHPRDYLPGFSIEATLQGHGLETDCGDGENIPELYQRIRRALTIPGPVALVNKRPMSPGIANIEGSTKGHDAIPAAPALAYLKTRGNQKAIELLEQAPKITSHPPLRGCSKEYGSSRKAFGSVLCDILAEMDAKERKERVLVLDSDLAGSVGLLAVRDRFPEIYVQSGIMERNNYGVAAGFGSHPRRQGIFGTFSAFLEMIISEITMARLAGSNVLAHFSHAGVDDMSDNTCHFGLNNLFAANGLPGGDKTHLCFPADALQMEAALHFLFPRSGLRFLFSTRSSVPTILDNAGRPYFDPAHYRYTGQDEVIREGDAGYVVSYGEMLSRSLDAVEQLREDGLAVGLINKPCLNIPDQEMLQRLGSAPFVLVVESQNRVSGLGMRFGSWLLEQGAHPRFARLASHRPGNCGMGEQITWQGLSPAHIAEHVRELAGS